MLRLRRAGRVFAGLLSMLFVTAACAAPLSQPLQAGATVPRQQRVLLQVPLIKQPYMRCLVASVSMVLKYWGYDATPDAIGRQVPVYKDGTTGRDLAAFVEAIGFQGFLIQPPFEDLLSHLEKGRPLVVSLPEGGSSRHAMVLVGFDLSSGAVWVNDPATGTCKSRPLNSFRKKWEKGQRWTFLIVPK
jgi:ABC-type bacteriocin/lantibiotic exporter with double-glycine peptidase domain